MTCGLIVVLFLCVLGWFALAARSAPYEDRDTELDDFGSER